MNDLDNNGWCEQMANESSRRYDYKAVRDRLDAANATIQDLTARLAAAEAERDDAKRILAIAVGRDEGVLSHIISELKQRLAAAEEEIKRLRGDGQFVVHTGDDLEYFDTEKEAIEAAQRAIYDLSEDSETGWPAIVENVKVMRVVHAVKRFDHVDDAGVPFTLYEIGDQT